MKIVLIAAGAILALGGTIFILQGIGLIQGSFMTSQTRWAFIGLAMDVVAVGLWIIAASQGTKRTL